MHVLSADLVTTMSVLHTSATLVMVGLIWFVQVVHYPLFARVGEDVFVEYELDHTRRTAWVVGPPMAIEGITAIALFLDPGDASRWWPVVGLVLLGIVHASTVALQVPAHQRLSTAWDADVARRLVRTNWLRTVGWSARGIVALVMLAAHLGS